MKKFIWLGLILFVAFIGCNLVDRDFSLAEEDFIDPGKGALVLVMDSSAIPTKTIAPTIVMAVDTYNVIGNHDLGLDSFSYPNDLDGLITENGLTPGNWTITVEAKNPNVGIDPDQNGTVIGRGVTSVLIEEGVATQVTVLVTPVDGKGGLHLTLNWVEGTVITPTVTASLDPLGFVGSIDYPAFLTPTNNPPYDTSSYDDADDNSRQTGYYTLIWQLKEAGTAVWGYMDVVRIIDWQATNRAITLSGNFEITSVTVDLQNPITIDFDSDPVAGGLQLVPTIHDQTAVLEILSIPSPSVSDFQWYLDGIALVESTGVIEGVDSATIKFFADSLALGTHNLGVLVSGTNTYGAKSFAFTVE